MRQLKFAALVANYLKQHFTPTGQPRIPVLTLHTTRDAVVPRTHQGWYADVVAAKGGSNNVVQRPVECFGHCAFTAGETLKAFQDLVVWAECGMKPAS